MSDELTKRKPRWSVGILSVLLLAAALVTVFLGWWHILTLTGLQERGEVVTGTVLKVDDSGRHQSIEVQYTTRAGKTVKSTTGNFRQAVVGQPIEIRYDRDHPRRMAVADSDLDTTFPKYFAGGLAVLFVIASVVAMRRTS